MKIPEIRLVTEDEYRQIEAARRALTVVEKTIRDVLRIIDNIEQNLQGIGEEPLPKFNRIGKYGREPI